tara:strand:+ start:1077 stop:1277 length:201 start_codon:yes stop_codon:yes gene_type:complete
MSKEINNQEKKSNELYTLLSTVLKTMEESQLMIEMEYGGSTTIQECIDKKEMPDVYYKIKSLLNGG